MGESTSHMRVETQDVARNDDVNSTSLSPQFLASLQLVADITAAASNGNTATPYNGPPIGGRCPFPLRRVFALADASFQPVIQPSPPSAPRPLIAT